MMDISFLSLHELHDLEQCSFIKEEFCLHFPFAAQNEHWGWLSLQREPVVVGLGVGGGLEPPVGRDVGAGLEPSEGQEYNLFRPDKSNFEKSFLCPIVYPCFLGSMVGRLRSRAKARLL